MGAKKIEVRIIRVMAWVIYPTIAKNLNQKTKNDLYHEMIKIERVLYLSHCGHMPKKTLLMTAKNQPYISSSGKNKEKPIYRRHENRLLDFFYQTADRWLLLRLPPQVSKDIKPHIGKIKKLLSGAMAGAML